MRTRWGTWLHTRGRSETEETNDKLEVARAQNNILGPRDGGEDMTKHREHLGGEYKPAEE